VLWMEACWMAKELESKKHEKNGMIVHVEQEVAISCATIATNLGIWHETAKKDLVILITSILEERRLLMLTAVSEENETDTNHMTETTEQLETRDLTVETMTENQDELSAVLLHLLVVIMTVVHLLLMIVQETTLHHHIDHVHQSLTVTEEHRHQTIATAVIIVTVEEHFHLLHRHMTMHTTGTDVHQTVTDAAHLLHLIMVVMPDLL